MLSLIVVLILLFGAGFVVWFLKDNYDEVDAKDDDTYTGY